MAFCTSCGKEIPENLKFCTACGAPVGEAAAAPAQQTAPSSQPVQPATPVTQQPLVQPAAPVRTAPSPPAPPIPVYADREPSKGSPYAVVSTGGWFGTILLFCLPLIGLIFCIVFACGGTKNLNKRNMAKAFLIFMIIGLVIGGLLVVLSLILGNWLQNLFQEAMGGYF